MSSKCLFNFTFLLLVFLVSGCSQNNLIDEPSNGNGNEDFDKTVKFIDRLLESGEITDNKSLISKVSKIEGYSGYEKIGNAIYLNFSDGNRYYVNFTGLSSRALFSTYDSVDNMDSYICQLEKLIGYDSLDETESESQDSICCALPMTEESLITNSRAGESCIRPVILKNRKVLFWSPLLTSDSADYKRFINGVAKVEKRLNVKIEVTSVLRSNQPTIKSVLKQMTKFSDYPIVVIDCHGAEKGELMIPRDTSVNSIGLTPGFVLNSNEEMEECYLLPEKYILNLLPQSLDRTIVWACMCYAFTENSSIKNAFTSRNVADFWGSTNSITSNIFYEQFHIFFSGFQAGFPSRKESPVCLSYTYTNKKGEIISGYLKNLSVGIPLCYARSKPIPNKRSAHGKIVFPRKVVSKKFAQSRSDEIEGRFFGFSLLGTDGNVNNYYLADVNHYATYNNTSQYPEVICLDYSVSLEWLEGGRYIFRTFVDTDDGRIYSPESYTLDVQKNYSEIYSGMIPHYHYYKYLLDDGTYNTIYEGTDECEAWAMISWKDGIPSVSLRVYTTSCTDFDGSGNQKKATSLGIPLDFETYSFQMQGNVLKISADLNQIYIGETSSNDTNISLSAEFDLVKGTLYIDYVETWKGVNEYGNVRALYHPQGTINRTSDSNKISCNQE